MTTTTKAETCGLCRCCDAHVDANGHGVVRTGISAYLACEQCIDEWFASGEPGDEFVRRFPDRTPIG